MSPTLALIHQLAAAIEAADPEQTFVACQDLAEQIGIPAAVALARSLAADVDAARERPRPAVELPLFAPLCA